MHSWTVNPKQAINIQLKLAKNIKQTPKKISCLEKIAGVDVSFSDRKCSAAICVSTWPGLDLIEKKTLIRKITFPYVPTLLTFREGPVVIACFKKLKNKPDVVLFDGQGIAHPRRMGLATHIGLWLELPTIGCAKSALFGKYNMPLLSKGSYFYIKDGPEIIGAVLRTKDRVKPLFVSPGHKIELAQAIEITLNSCTKYRIPQPLRAAHTLSKTTLTNYNPKNLTAIAQRKIIKPAIA